MERVPWTLRWSIIKTLGRYRKRWNKKIDFRISRYAPAAYVQEHVHQVQEQIYYVLEGEGVLTLDDKKHLMRPHDYVYVPPGITHSFTNTGTDGLVFFVITTPAEDSESM